MNDRFTGTDDPFLLGYNATDLRIASEFLANWLPFLSRGLCRGCTRTLSDRIQSLRPVVEDDGAGESLNKEDKLTELTSDPNKVNENNWDANSLGSWKDADVNDPHDMADTNSLGSWKDGSNGWSESIADASTSETVGFHTPTETPRVRMSWADMAQEDELESTEESDLNRELSDGTTSGEARTADKDRPKQELPRERREYLRFSSVKRKKDFICLERVNGKIVNILEGLELHAGVFSAAEQKRIVDYVYELEEMGRNKQLKERTYTAPQKWMRGKGRITIQFGCCYNYALDKNGNPPGILKKETVDPIPPLFKVIIRRLVKWHVLPPSCVPDSCIVNIYEEGDCIPPHIDNHDFLRPFCTVSFLSECNILFGTNLKIVGPGEFSGSTAIPLPVGSVLVLNGNGADVAKHCVPAVPTKRISITFRKMDESKWPVEFVPEPDLQGLQPLSYEKDGPKQFNSSNPKGTMNRQAVRREDRREEAMGSANRANTRLDRREEAMGSSNRANTRLDPRYTIRVHSGPGNRRRVKLNLDR